MAGKTPDRLSYTVACACGSKQKLDARGFGRPRVCRSWGRGYTLRWGKDRRTRRPVPVVVAQARMRAGVRDDETPFVALCACGYRRPIPEREAATPPKCPGCGRTMSVERVAGAPSKAAGKTPTRPGAPLLPLHLRPPMRIEVHAGTRVLGCPCGERLLLQPASFGKPTQCPNCDRWLLVEQKGTSIPAQPQRPTATRPRPPAPAPSRAAKPSREPGPGECVCPCGGIIPPRTSRTGREFTCASCGRKGRVEERSDAKPGEPALRAVITQEPPPASAGPQVFEVGPEEAATDQAQAAICECGAELLVSPADVGSPMQCPGCESMLVVEQAVDPLGGPPGLRIRKVEPTAEVDDSWNLEDFK